MSYEKVSQAKKTIIGTKQTVKAIRANMVHEVIIAMDAEDRLVMPIIEAARANGVKVFYVDSREELGQAAGIQVGAAAVAVIG